ncbi:MAG: DNA polymerase III subunit alpha [Lentisphaerae bacterium ADurb.BinA184]|nr:MAG: DNA polymerase III subunit alpha [Lentisphaerae bacterium ADurb.BinA184]
MLAICHTFYSLQTGVRSPDDWARAAAERGYSALAVADCGGLYGAVHFQRAVQAAGLQPIIGVRLGPDADSTCLALATSDEGYRQLCRMITARHLAPHGGWPALLAGGGDQVLFLSHTPGLLARLRDWVPSGNLYALPAAPRPGASLWDGVAPAGCPAPLPDAWLIDEADRAAFDDLARLRQICGVRNSISTAHPGAVLPDARQWREAFPDDAAAREIAERCRFTFQLGRPLLPRIHVPAGQTAQSHLAGLCRERLDCLYDGALRPRAADRLAGELAVITATGFADYFLYVHEIVAFALQRRIPVEVRGSAASSIVSYLLGFTHCCPLAHDLYFERFMNPGRRDCPDIDVDIADNRRDEVIRFCYQRWGEDRVAMIATLATYQARGALRDAGRLHGYPPATVSAIIEGRRDEPPESPLFRTAARLTGLPRHVGVHCGGLVITPGPLTDSAPLQRAAKGVVIIQYEKDQAEAAGLVKMDLLGNSALSVIDEGLGHLRARGVELSEPGPPYDYKVNRLFANGDTLGVYQCESPGMRQLCRALRPATPKQVAAALSLIRPGPAAAGMKEAFIKRQRGLEPVTYLHPRMADFLGPTHGVMLYQEDVMKVAVNVAGYSLGDADGLRRAVKGRGTDFLARERHRFVFEKAAAAGVCEATAEAIWEQVSRFASYSYCKAHAAVYGRLAWLTARLKAHHPKEFYAAICNGHKSMYPLRVFVWDAIRHGIPVQSPEINRSEVRWQPGPDGIRAGLGLIRGLRQAVCHDIVNARRQGSFRDLADLRCRVAFQGAELEHLILAGACRSLGRREELLVECRTGGRGRRQPALLPEPAPALPPLEQAEWELMGIPFSRYPLDPGAAAGFCQACDMKAHINREVVMLGFLDAVKHTLADGDGHEAAAGGEPREMSFVTLEDASGIFEGVLFPPEHRRFGPLFRTVGPYRLRGVVREQWDSLTLHVEAADREA